MDFFARQDRARKKRIQLYLCFAACVGLTIAWVYLLSVLFLYPIEILRASSLNGWGLPHFYIWQPALLAKVALCILPFIGIATFFKMLALRQDAGWFVESRFHGRAIRPNTQDLREKRLFDVVGEIAIASGLPTPRVYIMDRQKGINAFTMGRTVSNSVIVVTSGAVAALERDELQGIIAHEFSHIMHGDVDLNTLMTGILEGLLVVYQSGDAIDYYTAEDTNAVAASLRLLNPVVLFSYLFGSLLRTIGYAGAFCGQCAKAAICRTSERQADAAAVQFTRNPQGLAHALKKIGGLKEGSIIHAPYIAEVSHMCFGKGTEGAIHLLSTHPPLIERIRWLEPSFDGHFKPFTLPDQNNKTTKVAANAPRKTTAEAIVLGTTALSTAQAPSRPKINNPEALIDSIGAPMEHHADAARKLLDSIPEKVKEYAHDPYGARMLIYFLLLDARQEIRDQQMACIKEKADPVVEQVMEKALPDLDAITHAMRLPIVNLSMPALNHLSASQFKTFRDIVQSLIHADDRIGIFEYALRRILIHHLVPAFSGARKPRPVNYYSILGLERETSVVLSVLARKGNDDPQEQAAAFEAAVGRIAGAPQRGFQFLGEDVCTWKSLDAALDKINEGSFKVKKWVLGAALACLMHDREITVEEVELFRAIAVTLDCPVPPWVAPIESM